MKAAEIATTYLLRNGVPSYRWGRRRYQIEFVDMNGEISNGDEPRRKRRPHQRAKCRRRAKRMSLTILCHTMFRTDFVRLSADKALVSVTIELSQ